MSVFHPIINVFDVNFIVITMMPNAMFSSFAKFELKIVPVKSHKKFDPSKIKDL